LGDDEVAAVVIDCASKTNNALSWEKEQFVSTRPGKEKHTEG